jgi:ABC-type nitrate/sulfonate/bicarbonate transport system substrate-binding protein
MTIMGKRTSAIVLTCLLTAFLSVSAQAQPRNKIRIATGGPSLSYFPIYAAVQNGFFARRGFDVEMIQMGVTLTATALLNRAVDYTIIPSAIATAAARGASAKVIFFASVKLQHTLVVRSDIGSVTDLAGKRIAAAGFGNLLAYEVQFSSTVTSWDRRPPS